MKRVFRKVGEIVRINKFLQSCGVGSRRACDKLIEDGCVKVNGKVCEVGKEIDERHDSVTLNGKKLAVVNKFLYYIMNKPKGYVCTVKDDLGRKTVMDLLPRTATRVVPVGRLDYDSEGLLLFTNDGNMINRLTHPRNEVPKTYRIKIEGQVTEPMLNKIRAGVEIDGKVTDKSVIRIISCDDKFTKLSVTIKEGRNRQVRKMFEAIGKEVVFLKRVKIGDLELKGLDRGECRPLSNYEIEYLKKL